MTNFHLGAVPAPATGALANKGVLITRPMWQAAALAQTLATAGASPIIFPAIIIESNAAIDLAEAQRRLAHCTRAFFVSANAVREGLRDLPFFPEQVRAYGPGPGTAKELAACGVASVCTPTTSFDTVGLLALPELQSLAGERVMLFTGVGGKGDLAAALRARGANVEVVECYTRRAPETDARGVEALCAEGKLHASVFTSVEGIHNFWQCLSADGKQKLCAVPSFAPHPTVAAALRAKGVTAAIDCGPGDDALLAALGDFFHPSHT